MPLLTDLGTALWSMTAKAVAPFNAKADAWVKGRRGLFDRLEQRAVAAMVRSWQTAAVPKKRKISESDTPAQQQQQQ